MNTSNTKKKNLLYIVLFSVLLATIFVGVYLNNQKIFNTNTKKQIDFEKLEVARSVEEQAKGLMYRNELCQRCGMLFVFEPPTKLNFWMKNTFVDIDIIYLDKEKKVIERIVRPEKNNDFRTYPSKSIANFALEIPSTRADELNIKEGDWLLFDY
ncbi:MAG: DUF192 domain-containing protein [Patescibacteria group bacterium]